MRFSTFCILAIALVMALSKPSHGQTVRRVPTIEYPEIWDALGHALPGDTILVGPSYSCAAFGILDKRQIRILAEDGDTSPTFGGTWLIRSEIEIVGMNMESVTAEDSDVTLRETRSGTVRGTRSNLRIHDAIVNGSIFAQAARFVEVRRTPYTSVGIGGTGRDGVAHIEGAYGLVACSHFGEVSVESSVYAENPSGGISMFDIGRLEIGYLSIRDVTFRDIDVLDVGEVGGGAILAEDVTTVSIRQGSAESLEVERSSEVRVSNTLFSGRDATDIICWGGIPIAEVAKPGLRLEDVRKARVVDCRLSGGGGSPPSTTPSCSAQFPNGLSAACGLFVSGATDLLLIRTPLQGGMHSGGGTAEDLCVIDGATVLIDPPGVGWLLSGEPLGPPGAQ